MTAKVLGYDSRGKGSSFILTKTKILQTSWSIFVWSGIVNDVRTYWVTGESFYIPKPSSIEVELK
jgi:hypothetical protein